MNKIDEKRFKELRRFAEEAREERDRAAGQLEAAMQRLEEEFGCKTIKEAQRKLKALQKETDAAIAEYEKQANAFEEEWYADE